MSTCAITDDVLEISSNLQSLVEQRRVLSEIEELVSLLEEFRSGTSYALDSLIFSTDWSLVHKVKN